MSAGPRGAASPMVAVSSMGLEDLQGLPDAVLHRIGLWRCDCPHTWTTVDRGGIKLGLRQVCTGGCKPTFLRRWPPGGGPARGGAVR